jgi:hypothetical protein
MMFVADRKSSNGVLNTANVNITDLITRLNTDGLTEVRELTDACVALASDFDIPFMESNGRGIPMSIQLPTPETRVNVGVSFLLLQ